VIVYGPNMLIQEIPHQGLSAFIADLARRHGVKYEQTPSGELARVITHLSDDVVEPDATERLVIALRRAKVINGAAMVTMLGRYFDEIRDVRSVR